MARSTANASIESDLPRVRTLRRAPAINLGGTAAPAHRRPSSSRSRRRVTCRQSSRAQHRSWNRVAQRNASRCPAEVAATVRTPIWRPLPSTVTTVWVAFARRLPGSPRSTSPVQGDDRRTGRWTRLSWGDTTLLSSTPAGPARPDERQIHKKPHHTVATHFASQPAGTSKSLTLRSLCGVGRSYSRSGCSCRSPAGLGAGRREERDELAASSAATPTPTRPVRPPGPHDRRIAGLPTLRQGLPGNTGCGVVGGSVHLVPIGRAARSRSSDAAPEPGLSLGEDAPTGKPAAGPRGPASRVPPRVDPVAALNGYFIPMTRAG